MPELDDMMPGFYAGLEKEAAPVASIGRKALGFLSEVPGAMSRFGKRQAHALTGWTPQGGSIRSIRGGAYAAEEALRKAQAAGAATKQLERARDTAVAAEKMGLTSLPGYVKALYREGPMKALSTGLKSQWHSGGTGTKAMLVGVPGALAAGEALTPSEPGGPGKAQRVGRSLGQTAAYMLGPIPVAGQLALDPVMARLGGLTGKVVGKGGSKLRRKHTPAPPSLDPAGGAATPAETIASERAAGMMTGNGV
jgi:hypothetical protein